MSRHDSDSGAGFSLGILAGAAIGAGLALLFAPKAGRALRTDLADSVDSLRSAVAARYQALAARAGVEFENLHETVASATDALETRATAAVQSASRKVRHDAGV